MGEEHYTFLMLPTKLKNTKNLTGIFSKVSDLLLSTSEAFNQI